MVQKKQDYNIMIKKDGKFHTGYCLEIPQAREQGDAKKRQLRIQKKQSNFAGHIYKKR